MSPQDYHAYTQSLIDLAQDDERILGLIVLGSTAQTHHQPDQWSDHDFWLVVQEQTWEQFHADITWIPDHEKIVLAFRETQHGWKVVFDSGHVLEYAIFQPEDLTHARFYHYKLLVDKSDIAQRLDTAKTVKIPSITTSDRAQIAQHVLSLLVIGMGRYHRGEVISGHLFIKHHALEHLHALIQATCQPQYPHLVDHLSPGRRIEQTHPQYAEQLQSIITAPVPLAAQTILDMIVGLQSQIPNFPLQAIETVQRVIHYQP